MKKVLLFIIAAFVLSAPYSFAQGKTGGNNVPQRQNQVIASPGPGEDISGFRWFLDGGVSIHYPLLENSGSFEVTSSLGKQFGPFFFLGAGTGFQFSDKGSIVPLFADIRINAASAYNHSVIPFFRLNVGGAISSTGEGFSSGMFHEYIKPFAGIKFMKGHRKAISIQIGGPVFIGKPKFNEPNDENPAFILGEPLFNGLNIKFGLEL